MFPGCAHFRVDGGVVDFAGARELCAERDVHTLLVLSITIKGAKELLSVKRSKLTLVYKDRV